MSTGNSWNKRSNKLEWPAYSQLIWLLMDLCDCRASSVGDSYNEINNEWPGRYYCAVRPALWNRAEIRRPHFALSGFETAATPKMVQSTKEERIMDLLGEFEGMTVRRKVPCTTR